MSQIPFNPMQSQAAIQNPARFPDQKLQQYAAGKPPQPTGQVTPQMAGQELAQRGAERQAISRNAAMQNDPKNSPTIFQQLMMKEQMVNQQAQAIQQKEQQLGMAGAMIAKKAQDLAERERGIAALPMRPDMFTAMDGGIVFKQGGGVQGFKGGGDMSARIAEGFTEREDEPSTLGSSGVSPNDLMALIRKRMESIDEAEKTAMLSPEEKELMRFKNTQEMQKEYDEYARGRGERQQKVADALKGRAPDLGDYLGAMAAGGPGKTLAETLSRMVPGAAKLRTEYQAREMAAAKFLAEAEEKAAQADLAEKRGQRDVAAKLLQDEQALRLKAFEIKQGAARTGIQGLAAMQESQDRQASETRRAQEAAATRAFEEQKYREAPGRAAEQAKLEARLRREGRVPGVDERLYDDLTSGDPQRVARANTYLSGRYNTAARGQLTEAQVAKAVADFNDEFKGEQLRKQHGTVEKYLEYLRTTRANIGQGTSESSGEVVYDTSGKRVQ